MGAQADVTLRGDKDVVLTSYITAASQKDYEQFLEKAEDSGWLAADEYEEYKNNKAALI